MATDETAKRSNCNHESNRCHALTTASTLMKRILNRVKWFFKVMQGMSSDRPRAVRYTEKTTSVETSFHKKFGTELPRLEYCRKRKLATTPKPQTSGPRESTKNIYKNQAARPLKNRAAGTAVHSLPSSAEAWHVHSHPKTISRLRRSVRRIRENRRDAHAYANPRNR